MVLQRIAGALGRPLGTGAPANPAPRQSAIKEEYRGAYEAYLSKKPSSKIEPFLRLLYDNELIDCGGNPLNAEERTRTKIQKFVYFAQTCFGLDFGYRHTLYIYGPHSPTLANDYFRVRDIKDVPSGEPDSWPREGEFLDFAKSHNDADWLEIAGTLVYLRRVYKVPIGGLIDYADRIRYKFPEAQIKGVCEYLQDSGFVG